MKIRHTDTLAPAFEKVLREGLKRFSEAEFLNSTEATDLIIEENCVTIKTKNNLTGKTEECCLRVMPLI